jgi:glycosyltransferase involved in cell wall biosynthesis
MKILFLHDVAEKVGGAEIYLYGLIKSLEKDNEVFSIFQSTKLEKKSGRHKIYRNYYSNKFYKFISEAVFDFDFYRYLRKKINEIKPDVIHIHHNFKHSLSVLFALKGIPTVQTLHDLTLLCPIGWAKDANAKFCISGGSIKCFSNCLPWWRFSDFLFIRLRDFLIRKKIKRLIAPSKHLLESLKKRKFDNCTFIPYFIELDKWKKVSKKGVFNSSKKRLLYVGRLEKEKGVQIIINALYLLKGDLSWHLDIVGGGRYGDELIRLVKEKGLIKRVTFYGLKDQDEMSKFYKEAFVVLFPSLWVEQFGLVGVEALATGTPVIGSDVGGVPEWLENNKSGFLFPPGDEKVLAQKIKFLLSSPTLAKKMGEYGRGAVISYLSKEKHLKEIKGLYLEVSR